MAKITKKSTPGKKSSRSATTEPLLEGEKVPKFKAPSTSGETVKTMDLKGSWSVLYFYPKDNTSGCTKESQDFRDQFKKFKKLGVRVLGISPDSLVSHQKFIAQHKLPFELLSDETKEVCQAFQVWKEKNMYGRVYWGVERSTFLISPTGKIVKEWRRVKVPGHVENVLEVASEAQA